MTGVIKKPFSGWAVLSAFIAFFGVIVVVNSIFIYMALETNPGVIAENTYKTGLNYNEVLDRARQQAGFISQISFEGGVLELDLRDNQGHAIEGASVSAAFIRPVQQGYDFSGAMQEKANGLYVMKPAFPLNGDWNVRLSVKWNNQNYQTSKEVVVR